MRLWKWQLDDNEIEFEDREAVNQTDGELNDTIITYEENTSDVQSWTDFIASFVNGMKIGKFFKNLYAGIQYVLHIGSLVNNCVTDNEALPLAASQGKVLMDEITQLNSALDSATTVTYEEVSPDLLSGTIRLVKCGHWVLLTSSERSTTAAISREWTFLFTIPEGYRPPISLYVTFPALTSDTLELQILPSGEVNIFPRVSGGLASGTNLCLNVVWYVA